MMIRVIHRATATILAVVALAASVSAQTVDSSCSYASCALSISPRLMGLDVVRGTNETRVASLGFLLPHDPTRVFATDSIARRFATRALTHRRIGAALTDVGLVVAVLGASQGKQAGTIGVGLALVISSIPIHFSADADLSRAVWHHNRHYSR